MFSTPLLCGKIANDYRRLLTRNFDFFMLRACNEKSIWVHEFNFTLNFYTFRKVPQLFNISWGVRLLIDGFLQLFNGKMFNRACVVK